MMYLRSYNARQAKAEGKKLGAIQHLILLRSDPLTHSEIEFSNGWSFSATLQDGCKCVRAKRIDYTKHPKRWKTTPMPFTKAQELRAWFEACSMAGLPVVFANICRGTYEHNNGCFYIPDAIKYDIAGQVCHIFKMRLIKPNPNRTWCSKAVLRILFAPFTKAEQDKRFHLLHTNRDEITPQELDDYVNIYDWSEK